MKPNTFTQLGVLCGVAALASAAVWHPALGQGPAERPNSPAPVQWVATNAAQAQTGQTISLDEALTQARANEPAFNAAVAASKAAALDRSIARAAVLPQVAYHNQFVYTEGYRRAHSASTTNPNQAQPPQIFIANNGVHEYVSQASVTETIGLGSLTAISRATALAAVANAEAEISRRGLTVTVVTLFYGSIVADDKVQIQRRALDEANDFVNQTQLRETAREVAHADVLKAQLTQQQRQRDLADATLAAAKARIDLGVLLFPDPLTPYSVVPPTGKPLSTRAEVEASATANSPEIRSALQSLRARNYDITGAQGAYLPNLSVNFLYGIDAPQFALNGRISPDGIAGHYDDAPRNLGYAASATLDIPVFDWFATPNRIRQTRILRDAAKTVLSSAQRSLIAAIKEFYDEATLAQQQLDSLDLSVRTAGESLRLTRLRYTAGEATVLEVVDAQNSMTQAELARADGNTRYQLSLANLQLLTGTI